eukprot:TRINITY_DN15670_c0_g2_i1.p1 TRINITY_DN15670_c0_g2~~TRINITY_DN15670_c0_g2_i1.p1  ORF type:complete len:772 (+),score=131.44 TRINITY_DN15670_c0_g2_i1:94-2409(+)
MHARVQQVDTEWERLLKTVQPGPKTALATETLNAPIPPERCQCENGALGGCPLECNNYASQDIQVASFTPQRFAELVVWHLGSVVQDSLCSHISVCLDRWATRQDAAMERFVDSQNLMMQVACGKISAMGSWSRLTSGEAPSQGTSTSPAAPAVTSDANLAAFSLAQKQGRGADRSNEAMGTNPSGLRQTRVSNREAPKTRELRRSDLSLSSSPRVLVISSDSVCSSDSESTKVDVMPSRRDSCALLRRLKEDAAARKEQAKGPSQGSNTQAESQVRFSAETEIHSEDTPSENEPKDCKMVSSMLDFSVRRVMADAHEINIDELLEKEPRDWYQKLVATIRTPTFDFCCGLPVFVFALFLGVETEYMCQHTGDTHVVFSVMHMMFNVWFLVEMIVRMLAYRKEFWFGEDKVWNILDVCMVLVAMFDIVLGLITINVQASSMAVMRAVKGLRILRLLKTCRIARSLRYVHEFKKMVFSLQASLTTLLWCLSLIFSLLYIFSIVFTQGVLDYLLINEGAPELLDDLHKYYGSMPKSVYSLYIAMSNGMSWDVLLRPLFHVDAAYAALFLFYITFSMFGLLNVLTSVFVESTMKSAQHYKDLVIQEAQYRKDTSLTHLKTLFAQMDKDGDGLLSMDEMRRQLTMDECNGYLEACDISINDCEVLFRLIDRDNSGAISIAEFCEGCLTLKGEARSFDIHCLIYEQSRFLDKWYGFLTEFDDKFSRMDDSVSSLRQDLDNYRRIAARAAAASTTATNVAKEAMLLLTRFTASRPAA